MKKLAIILAFMMIPCTAFSMQTLNNSAMSQITGQSGVSITFDDVQMFVNIDRMAYIDSDGFKTLEGYNTSSTAGGALYIENFQMDTLNINAILGTTTHQDWTTVGSPAKGTFIGGTTQSGGATGLYSSQAGDIPLQFNYANTNPTGSYYLGTAITGATNVVSKGLDNIIYTNSAAGATNRFQAQAINIDVVDALPVLTEGWQANYAGVTGSSVGTLLSELSVGGVLISLPTVEINIGSLSFTPKYTGYIGTTLSGASNDAINATNLGITSNFGTIELDGIDVAILSGWMEIAPH